MYWTYKLNEYNYNIAVTHDPVLKENNADSDYDRIQHCLIEELHGYRRIEGSGNFKLFNDPWDLNNP